MQFPDCTHWLKHIQLKVCLVETWKLDCCNMHEFSSAAWQSLSRQIKYAQSLYRHICLLPLIILSANMLVSHSYLELNHSVTDQHVCALHLVEHVQVSRKVGQGGHVSDMCYMGGFTHSYRVKSIFTVATCAITLKSHWNFLLLNLVYMN